MPGSREKTRFIVYGFGSTHRALAAERTLLDAGVGVTPIPAPRDFGELCGIALRVSPPNSRTAEKCLAEAGLSPDATGDIWDV
ncbi:MAG: DUF3343 domain-containing protein [Actinomycetota bacterium]|nr:DUF3343 domain-containing protein [Actinomycetota bacterium]